MAVFWRLCPFSFSILKKLVGHGPLSHVSLSWFPLKGSLKNPDKGIKLKKGLSTKILSKSLANNFNEEFKSLNENEKKLFNEIISLDDKNITSHFDTTKKTIVENINSLIKETKEDQLLTRLVETKNSILTMDATRKNLLSIKQLSQDLK